MVYLGSTINYNRVDKILVTNLPSWLWCPSLSSEQKYRDSRPVRRVLGIPTVQRRRYHVVYRHDRKPRETEQIKLFAFLLTIYTISE